MDTFYMVWVTGTEGTHKRYELKADAEAEAERLARRTQKPAYLMESVAVCSISDAPVQWEKKE